MKNIFFPALFVLTFTFLNSQKISFEKTIISERNEGALDFIELSDSYIFYVSSLERNLDELRSKTQHKILKLGKDGTILGKKVIASIDSLHAFGFKLLALKDKYFLLGFYSLPDNADCTFGKFFVMTLDKDFNLIKEITTDYKDEFVFKVFAEVIGNEIIAGVGINTCNDHIAFTEFYKIDEEGNVKIKKRYPVEFELDQPFSICQSLDKNGYIAVGWANYKLDSNLNIIPIDIISQFWFSTLMNTNACSVIRWDDAKYLLSYSSNDNGDFGLRFIDKNLRTIKDTALGLDTRQVLVCQGTSASYIDRNAIFLAGFVIHNPWGKFPEYPIVAKLDSNLNVIWEKTYFSEKLINIWNSRATTDGGVILIGTSEDLGFAHDPREFHAYILKVDGDGNLNTFTDEQSIIWDITIYPNPSSGVFRLKFNDREDARYSIAFLDINGKVVFKKSSLKSEEQIDLSSIASGNYIYQIHRNDSIIKTGKWIKK